MRVSRTKGSFVVGFVLTAIVLIVLNVQSYQSASSEFNAEAIHFSHTGFRWGFPFPIIYQGTCSPCDWVFIDNLIGTSANVIFGLLAGFAVGFLFSRIACKTNSEA